jgi:Integrase core domain
MRKSWFSEEHQMVGALKEPVQNALIGNFIGKFRDECLNQNWLVSLTEPRKIMEAWRVDYNTVRPHGISDAEKVRSERREPNGRRHAFAPFRKKSIVAGFVHLFRHACRVPFCTTTLPLHTAGREPHAGASTGNASTEAPRVVRGRFSR